MEFTYPPEAERFRAEVKRWLDEHLVDEYRALGTGAEFDDADWKVRVAWEREMGAGNWIGIDWPRTYGGREATLMESLVFAEEYARAGGPTRSGTFGEGMLGPLLIHFGSDPQKRRFLPPILRGEQIWCQGFSEPAAGSDLAALTTRARLDGDHWVIDGQKVWTSQANQSEWIFALVRTEPDAPKHQGISLLLIPLDQPGIDIRPLRDMAGGRHFCEVFFDGATTDADLVVGARGDGWKMGMAILGFERGTAFVGQLERYGSELQRLVDVARERGTTDDPRIRQQLADLYIGLRLMRFGVYRTLSAVLKRGRPGPEASINKLQWSQWHQNLGLLATEILGADAMLAHATGQMRDIAHSFLFSRAHTIYAGSSQVQRNIIGERVLGLPKEPISH
jgi:alkylation response protein AidB-like acyl-CoA dehydrogenase